MTTPFRTTAAVLVMASPLGTGLAQDAPSVLDMRIEARQQRIAHITEEMIELDRRIESRVDEVVRHFETITDSDATGTRVTRMRGEIIEALQKNAEMYARRRDAVRAELDEAHQGIDEDTLKGDLDVFDDRILKRLGQAVALGEAFAPPEEHDKYVVVYKDSPFFRNRSERSIRKNEDYVRNERTQRSVNAQLKPLEEGIDSAIEHLENKNRELSANLDRNDITDDRKARMRDDIERNEQLLGHLRESKGDLVEPTNPPASEEITRTEANDITAYLKDLAVDLERDQTKLFGLYHELNAERAALGQLLEHR